VTLARPSRKATSGFAERSQAGYSSRAGIGHNNKRMRPPVTFAITFDLDTKILEETYPQPTWQNAYKDVARFLREHGFDRQQGSVYFGNDDVDVVRCQMAVQRLTMEFEWFGPSVKDIRMLRIEDNNDLMPAIDLAMQMKAK
jgi:virulence-associated protein VapD